MDLSNDTSPAPTFEPPSDANEGDDNEDALFAAPPELDDSTSFHDANPDTEAIALPSTPMQGTSIAPSQALPPSTLSLEDRVAHFTTLFGDIKGELQDTKEYLRNAQAQASIHEAQLNHFAKKEAQQDVDHQDVLSRLS